MTKKLVKKKGISPVIASILLVVIVVVIATIIFVWARSFIQESIKKQDLPADQACAEVKFDASASPISGQKITLDVVNKGNLAIQQLNIKKVTGGSSEVEHVQLMGGTGLTGGEGDSLTIQVAYSATANYQQLIIIPEILGTTNKGVKKIYTCPERYGITLELS